MAEKELRVTKTSNQTDNGEAFTDEERRAFNAERTAERTLEREAKDEHDIVNAIDAVMTLRDLVFVLGRLETRFEAIRRNESRGRPGARQQTLRQAEDIVRALGRALGSEDREGIARMHEPTIAVLGPHEAPADE
jgi:hypothetical protein